MLKAIARHPSGRIGGVIVCLYVVVAILGTLGITPHDPLMQYRIDRLHAPNAVYWMGTDLFGRDGQLDGLQQRVRRRPHLRPGRV